MDGSGSTLIAIPVVATVSLAVWLFVVYYAASHPRWRHGPAASSVPSGKGSTSAPLHAAVRSLPAADDGAHHLADPGRPAASRPAAAVPDKPQAA